MKLWKIFLALVIVVIAVLVWSFSQNPQPIRMNSDDAEERPPVVVSSGGSIIFDAQDKGDGTGHGTLTTVSDTEVKHDHDRLPPKRFLVEVTNATCDIEGPYDAKRIEGKYGNGIDTNEFVIREDGQNLRINTRPIKYSRISDWQVALFQGDRSWHLVSAAIKVRWVWEFYFKTVNCTFNDGATIVVHQKKQ